MIKIEIPEIFKRFDNKEMFTECVVCKKNLLEENTEYIIEKAIRNYPDRNVKDVIFEYAMCFDCINNIKTEFSKESLKRIQDYFDSKIDLLDRLIKTIEYGKDFKKYIEKCVVTNEPISQTNEYIIQAHCQSDKLLLSILPIAISEKVYDDIAELLSNKTLDFLNGFMDDYFDYPPEVSDIFKRRPIFI